MGLLGSQNGQVSQFISYLAHYHPDVLFSGITASQPMIDRLHRMLIHQPIPVRVSLKDGAEIVIAADLSQRSYKVLKNKLKDKNLLLPRYDDVSKYLRELDVGPIIHLPHDESHTQVSGCICAVTKLKDTMQRLISTKQLFDSMEFPSMADQAKLFELLKEKDRQLYSGLRIDCKTLFIRQSGDNYRSFRMPTQQMSFSVLNLKKLVGSPFGQVISGIWRGEECRHLISVHCLELFEELDTMVRNGIDINCDGVETHFNVIVLYGADLSHMGYVLGRAGLTAKYGCWRCKKEQGNGLMQNLQLEEFSLLRNWFSMAMKQFRH